MSNISRPPTTAWGLSGRIEVNYGRQLKKVAELILNRLENANTPDEILRILRVISNDSEFKAYCEALAENMAKQIYREVNRNWRSLALEAAHKRGRLIYEELQRELKYSSLGQTITDIVIENSRLIKTIPDTLAKELASAMSKESAFSGGRSINTAKEINDKFKHLLPYEANRIARTETSKAHMALTQARAQNLGFNWYIWRTAHDGDRVRPSHRKMEGVLVNWNNPPSPEALNGENKPPAPYNAGNIYNCRCYAEPVINLDWIDFPCDVYINGSIQKMTRAAFEQAA